jgi:heat shock protein beta
MIKKLSEADRAINGEQSADSEVDREDPELKANADKWATLWKEFGKALKLGVIEDVQNRQRLAKLIRFYTSKSPDKLTSLEDYVARMKSEQKDIYYLAGESIKELQGSPFLEQLLAKDYEVIFFTDPVDEYLMQNLQDYDDIKFQNASKDDLKLADKDQKKENKKLKEKFKELVKWWQGALEDDSVEAVRLSTRLATSPCVVVTSKYGWTANMERIMRAQALGDAEKQAYMKGRRILEINPHHPLIQELKARQEADKDSKATASLAKLLYETALLESGFQLNDAKAFNTRVYSLVKDALDLKGELSVPPQLEKEQEAQDVDDSAELSDDVDSSAGMDEQIHKDEL